jgi:lipoprotein signal peptidase
VRSHSRNWQLLIVLIVVDQLSKYFLPAQPVSAPVAESLRTIGALVVLVPLIMMVCRQQNKKIMLATTVVVAGGVSNLVDRIALGAVRDIFLVGTFAFNVADIAIVVGFAIFIFKLFRSKELINY